MCIYICKIVVCIYIYITEIGFWGRFLLKYIGTSMITVLITANDVPLDFIAGELLKPQRENTLKNQFVGMKPRDIWF
jgi:hypothetical protein